MVGGPRDRGCSEGCCANVANIFKIEIEMNFEVTKQFHHDVVEYMETFGKVNVCAPRRTGLSFSSRDTMYYLVQKKEENSLVMYCTDNRGHRQWFYRNSGLYGQGVGCYYIDGFNIDYVQSLNMESRYRKVYMIFDNADTFDQGLIDRLSPNIKIACYRNKYKPDNGTHIVNFTNDLFAYRAFLKSKF